MSLPIAIPMVKVPHDTQRLMAEELERRRDFEVARGRFTEEALVFAGELTRALLAHFESGPSGVQSLDEHPLPRAHQSKLFLILQWA